MTQHSISWELTAQRGGATGSMADQIYYCFSNLAEVIQKVKDRTFKPIAGLTLMVQNAVFVLVSDDITVELRFFADDETHLHAKTTSTVSHDVVKYEITIRHVEATGANTVDQWKTAIVGPLTLQPFLPEVHTEITYWLDDFYQMIYG